MITADVLIVGAGPAGATAAKYLADYGLNTVLVDQAVFPRQKACGDGVTAEGIEALIRMGLEDWTKQFAEMDVLRLSSPDQQILDVWIQSKDGRCNGRTIPRKLLDNAIVQNAVGCGAKFVDNTKINRLEIDENGVRAFSNHQSFDGKLVLLADGSNATVTRKLGLIKNSIPDLIAIRQYLSGDSGPANRLEIHFHSWILPGYNWIFPLGDGNTNIGTGTYTRRTKNGEVDLPAVLKRFKSDPLNRGRLDKTEETSTIKGAPLRTQFGQTQTHSNRIMVLGDAAGLINPFTGEGIAPAIQSGEIASIVARRAFEQGDFSEKSLSAYSQALDNRYSADRKAAQFLRKAMNTSWILNLLFKKLMKDDELARLVALMIIGQKSPRLIFKPANLLKFLY